MLMRSNGFVSLSLILASASGFVIAANGCSGELLIGTLPGDASIDTDGGGDTLPCNDASDPACMLTSSCAANADCASLGVPAICSKVSHHCVALEGDGCTLPADS